jgi:hypothetical protein
MLIRSSVKTCVAARREAVETPGFISLKRHIVRGTRDSRHPTSVPPFQNLTTPVPQNNPFHIQHLALSPHGSLVPSSALLLT